MIGMLKGLVWDVQGSGLILDVHGVGYEVIMPGNFLSRLKIGQEITVYTQMIIREDDLALYGFSSLEEKLLFLDLLSVSGIGPKAGMAILSTYGAGQVVQAIATGDVTMLTKVPGIGKKTAQRLVLELKEKYKGKGFTDGVSEVTDDRSGRETSDVLDALISLGFSMEEGKKALKAIPDGLSVEDQIKTALKILSER